MSNFDHDSSQIIIKVVNLSDELEKSTIKINGVKNISPIGTAITLTLKELTDENTYDNPTKVSTITKAIDRVSTEFTYEFLKYSVTVLRLQI